MKYPRSLLIAGIAIIIAIIIANFASEVKIAVAINDVPANNNFSYLCDLMGAKPAIIN